MEDKIKEVIDAWKNGTEELGLLRRQMREDLELATGDQWYMVDAARKTRSPYLSIDIISGRIRRRSGFIRQNMPEARVVSLSSRGDEFCDVMQQALKYIYSDKDNYINRVAAIDDALTCGLGWLHVYIDYNSDIVNGDVRIMKVSPFDIVFDPYISTPDFRDMSYVVHRSYMTKNELKKLYPKYKRDIDDITEENEASYETEVARIYKSLNDMVNVFDYWYIKHEPMEMWINVETGEYGVLEKDMPPPTMNVKIVERDVPRVYLRRVISNSLIVYDDKTPYVKDRLPYIPIVCYANMTHPEWQYRIKGIARRLRDLQLEKNKRRSAIMKNVLNKFLRGYKKLREETADLSEYLEGESEVLVVDSMDSIQEIPPPQIPEALMVLEKEIDNDLNVVDANLQMLDSATTYQAVGALQLKLRESLLVDQEIYDNVNYAMYKLSSYIVDLINENWTTHKFKMLVGYNMPYAEEYKALEQQAQEVNQVIATGEQQEELLEQGQQIMQQVALLQQKIDKYWFDFDKDRKDIKFLIKFGEGVEETPTYKLAYLNTFTSLKHQGQNVPDEIYIEFLDIPKRLKDKWLMSIQSQQQAQMQIMQMQQQHEMNIEQLRAQIKMVIQDMVNEGKLELQKLKAKDVYEYDITKRVAEADNANTSND